MANYTIQLQHFYISDRSATLTLTADSPDTVGYLQWGGSPPAIADITRGLVNSYGWAGHTFALSSPTYRDLAAALNFVSFYAATYETPLEPYPDKKEGVKY